MAYYSNLFSCINPNGSTAPVEQQQNLGGFSGKGRSLSSNTNQQKENIPSEEISPDITRQRLLNATLSRLNKEN